MSSRLSHRGDLEPHCATTFKTLGGRFKLRNDIISYIQREAEQRVFEATLESIYMLDSSVFKLDIVDKKIGITKVLVAQIAGDSMDLTDTHTVKMADYT